MDIDGIMVRETEIKQRFVKCELTACFQVNAHLFNCSHRNMTNIL